LRGGEGPVVASAAHAGAAHAALVTGLKPNDTMSFTWMPNCLAASTRNPAQKAVPVPTQGLNDTHFGHMSPCALDVDLGLVVVTLTVVDTGGLNRIAIASALILVLVHAVLKWLHHPLAK